MSEAGASAEARDGARAPWEERAARGLLPAFQATWKQVAFRPGAFLGALADRPGPAVLYGWAAASLGLFLSSFYSALSARHWWDVSRDLALELGPERGAALQQRWLPYLSTGFSLAEALTAPLKVALGLFVGAAVTHVVLVLLRAATRGFAGTLTVVGYAFGLALLLALPVCGFPLVSGWLLVALVAGVSAAHRCATWQAAVAVLTPGVAAILFGLEPWLALMFSLVRTVKAAAGAG